MATAPQSGIGPSGSGRLGIRHVIAVGAGNALGFYDFLVFSFFSIQIGRTIFPAAGESSALLLSLATFGVGFLTRPVGAAVLGRVGDRIGRRPAMMISLGITGVGVAGQALVPSYATAGLLAPVLMVLLRLLVGFGLGGEVGPSTAYLVEAAPVNRRALYVSIQAATQDLSVLVAGIVGEVLALAMSEDALNAWGWRLAFAIGAAAVPVAFWIRSKLPETVALEEQHPSPAMARFSGPSGHRSLLLILFVFISTGTISSYLVGYLTTYAQDTLRLPAQLAFSATIGQGISTVACDLLGGWLADRYGRRPMMVIPQVVFLAAIVPCFLLLQAWPTSFALAGVGLVLGALSALPGCWLVAVTEALPRQVRARSVGIVYSIGVAVFGGSAQFVAKWIQTVTGNPMAPAWYLLASQVIWLGAALTIGETSPLRGRRAAAPAGART